FWNDRWEERPVKVACPFLRVTQPEHIGAREVNMQNTKPVPQEQIFSIVLGFWQARALAVATELGLPDLLADGPLHIDELTRRTKTNASALFRLLRALESIGIFTQTSPRVFGNTPTSECLRRDVPGSQWASVLHSLSKGNGPFEAWEELEYAVKTGEPSLDKIYGYDFWELLRRNPDAYEAMRGDAFHQPDHDAGRCSCLRMAPLPGVS